MKALGSVLIQQLGISSTVQQEVSETLTQEQVHALKTDVGSVGGVPVSVDGLTDGDTTVYDAVAQKFVVAKRAQGAAGSGLYATPVFELAVGQEVAVQHQQVVGNRAVYQAEAVTTGATIDQNMRAPSVVSGLVAQWVGRTEYRAAPTFSGASKGTDTTVPLASAYGLSYIVDGTIYYIAGYGSSGKVTGIYMADATAPSTWTASTDLWPGSYGAMGRQVFDYGEHLYVFGGAGDQSIWRAHKDSPTKWTACGQMPEIVYDGAAFIIGNKVYLCGGVASGAASAKIWVADIGVWTWTLVGNLVSAVCRAVCWQYNGYLYILGGETAIDKTWTRLCYRAAITTPTTWTSLGNTVGTGISYSGALVWGNRIILFGGRRAASTWVNTVQHADAGNPLTWTALTGLTATLCGSTVHCVGNTAYICGGWRGSSVQTVQAYTLSHTSGAVSVAQLTFQETPVSTYKTLVKLLVQAYVPSGGSVKAAIAFDGVWSYWNGSQWATSTDVVGALSSAPNCTQVDSDTLNIAGAQNLVLTASRIQLALRIVGAANSSPLVYGCDQQFLGADVLEPLQLGSYSSSAELGVRHISGDYQVTRIKNLKASALSLVLKVFDGATV